MGRCCMKPLLLTKEEFQKLTRYSSNSLQASSFFYSYDDEHLIKKFIVLPSNEKTRNITYLINCNYPNYIGPEQLCYVDGVLIGYVIPKLTNFHTFRHYINKEKEESITLEERLNIISDLFTHLRAVHQDGKLIGDIHLDNLLYKTNEFSQCAIKQGLVCDLDDYFWIGKDKRCRQLYKLVPRYGYEDMIITPTIAADNIKATICSLSLLYHQDFEQYVYNPCPEEEVYQSIYVLLKHLRTVITDDDFYEEIEKILNNYYGLEPITYFDEIAPMILKSKTLKNKRISHK